MLVFTKELIRKMFLDAKNLSNYQVGLKYEMDKYYKNRKSIIAVVHKYYNQVKFNPKEFDISDEVVKEITAEVERRKGHSGLAMINPNRPSLRDREGIEDYGALDTKELVSAAKKKAWVHLLRKLDTLEKRGQLLKTPISMLAQVAGIAFDKGQIVKGEATEHIALHAKIDKNLSPQQKMELLQQLRERLIEKVSIKNEEQFEEVKEEEKSEV